MRERTYDACPKLISDEREERSHDVIPDSQRGLNGISTPFPPTTFLIKNAWKIWLMMMKMFTATNLPGHSILSSYLSLLPPASGDDLKSTKSKDILGGLSSICIYESIWSECVKIWCIIFPVTRHGLENDSTVNTKGKQRLTRYYGTERDIWMSVWLYTFNHTSMYNHRRKKDVGIARLLIGDRFLIQFGLSI